MLARTIEELGRAAFDRELTPLRRPSWTAALVLGFDTEYDSRTGKLICYQVSDGAKSVLVECKRLTVAELARTIAREFDAPRVSEVFLAAYFSIAELQFLPVLRESFEWREYGTGSFDCSFYDEKRALTLRVFDLARFFDKSSLAAVAESFGLAKKKWRRDRVSARDLLSPKFREYAKHDAKLCADIVSKLREQFAEWSVDPIHEKTAASTAASVFRRGWVAEPIGVDCNRARLAAMRGTWGGRAEALGRGNFAHLREYDLKSAYPLAAVTLGELPCNGSWREVKSLAALLKCRGGFAHVGFEFPADDEYPSLPVVLPSCQLYPLAGREWVTFDEVRSAVEHGAEIRLFEAWGYSRGTSIVCDYMEEILARRARATGAGKVALKLLANSLIGKFAQRVSDLDVEELRRTAESMGLDITDVGKMTRDELAALGIESRARVGSVFMPEWNGLVTGRVRARIGELVRESRAVYVATDAVWTERRLSKLPDDLVLKREGRAVVARTRLGVLFDDEKSPHIAMHSIWNRAAALAALQSLEVPRSEYETRRPTKLRESLRSGTRFGKWVRESRTADTKWDLKRRLVDNGRRSEPWRSASEYIGVVADARAQA